MKSAPVQNARKGYEYGWVDLNPQVEALFARNGWERVAADDPEQPKALDGVRLWRRRERWALFRWWRRASLVP